VYFFIIAYFYRVACSTGVHHFSREELSLHSFLITGDILLSKHVFLFFLGSSITGHKVVYLQGERVWIDGMFVFVECDGLEEYFKLEIARLQERRARWIRLSGYRKGSDMLF